MSLYDALRTSNSPLSRLLEIRDGQEFFILDDKIKDVFVIAREELNVRSFEDQTMRVATKNELYKVIAGKARSTLRLKYSEMTVSQAKSAYQLGIKAVERDNNGKLLFWWGRTGESVNMDLTTADGQFREVAPGMKVSIADIIGN